MASTIGIKLANGEFYPIVEENSQAKKRLVLTTVRDKQNSVQIDLYKSDIRSMADAFYIGSLVVESVSPRSKGDASIELVITSTKDGEITADAMDMDSSALGEHHTLHVSLKSLNDDDRQFGIPDFELDDEKIPPSGLYEETAKLREEKQVFPWLVLICIVLVLIAIGLAVWLFFFQGTGEDLAASGSRPMVQGSPSVSSQPASSQTPSLSGTPSVPAAPAQPSVQAPVQQQAQTPQPPPVIQAPVQAPPVTTPARRTRPVPPVSSYRVPAVIPREGAAYTIRPGDTLWDIAEAFYRNPWLYPNIARFNNIRNPDIIYSGTTIRVPPRN